MRSWVIFMSESQDKQAFRFLDKERVFDIEFFTLISELSAPISLVFLQEREKFIYKSEETMRFSERDPMSRQILLEEFEFSVKE